MCYGKFFDFRVSIYQCRSASGIRPWPFLIPVIYKCLYIANNLANLARLFADDTWTGVPLMVRRLKKSSCPGSVSVINLVNPLSGAKLWSLETIYRHYIAGILLNMK